MDKMSLVALLTVSLPQNVLALLFVLSISDELRYLKINIPNMIRLIAFSLVSLGLIYVVRLYSPNLIVSSFLVVITYSLLVKVFYFNIDILPVLGSSTLYMISMFILEALYVPAAMTAYSLNQTDVLGNDLYRFLLSLPEELVITISFALIAKYQQIKEGISFYVKSQKLFRLIIFMNLLVISSVFYIFIRYMSVVTYWEHIAFCFVMLVIAVSNILLFNLLFTVVNEVYTKIEIERRN